MYTHLDKDTLCKVYLHQSADRHRNRQRNDRNYARWWNLDNWCRLRSSSRNCPHVRDTHNVGNEGSSRSQAHIDRRFCRRCWDDICSVRFRRRRNCRVHRRRHNRRECIPPDRIRRFPVRNDHNVYQLHLACTGTSRHSSCIEDCENPLDYIRKLKFNIVLLWVCD